MEHLIIAVPAIAQAESVYIPTHALMYQVQPQATVYSIPYYSQLPKQCGFNQFEKYLAIHNLFW